jgi:hypothetical protein
MVYAKVFTSSGCVNKTLKFKYHMVIALITLSSEYVPVSDVSTYICGAVLLL